MVQCQTHTLYGPQTNITTSPSTSFLQISAVYKLDATQYINKLKHE